MILMQIDHSNNSQVLISFYEYWYCHRLHHHTIVLDDPASVFVTGLAFQIDLLHLYPSSSFSLIPTPSPLTPSLLPPLDLPSFSEPLKFS